VSILFLLFINFQASAFNTFHWLNDAIRSSTMIGPRSDINGEYDSDFLTYQKPLDWEYKFLKSNAVFDLSVGSVSSKEFLFDQRAKLYKDLTSKFFFSLDWLEIRDYEQDVRGFGYELGYRFWPKLTISAIGSPSYLKSEDDVGGKITLFEDEWKAEVAAVWYDFQNNFRALHNRRWAKRKEPWSVLGQVTWMPKGEERFARFGVMNQFHSRMEDSSASSVEENSAFRLFFQHWMKNEWGSQVQWEHIFRSTTADGKVQRKRLWVQFEKYFMWRNYSLKPGLNFFYRDYQTGNMQSNGPHIITHTWLPAFWVEFAPSKHEEFDSIWSLGLDAAFFDSDRGESKSGIDERLNVKNTLRFNKDAELVWQITFDVDQLISMEFWEGGNVQFRANF